MTISHSRIPSSINIPIRCQAGAYQRTKGRLQYANFAWLAASVSKESFENVTYVYAGVFPSSYLVFGVWKDGPADIFRSVFFSSLPATYRSSSLIRCPPILLYYYWKVCSGLERGLGTSYHTHSQRSSSFHLKYIQLDW